MEIETTKTIFNISFLKALLAPGNACESRVFTYTTAKGRVVGAAYSTT